MKQIFGQTVLIVGAAGYGQSRLIEHILAEVGMTMHEPIMVGDEVMTGEELQVRINQQEMLHAPEPMEIRMLDVPEMPEYQYTRKDLENAHPFSKFMSKGFKRR